MDLLKPHLLRLVLVERNVVGGSGRATVRLNHSGTCIQYEPYCRPMANVKTIIPNNLKLVPRGTKRTSITLDLGTYGGLPELTAIRSQHVSKEAAKRAIEDQREAARRRRTAKAGSRSHVSPSAQEDRQTTFPFIETQRRSQNLAS
jgi:hypothetical protein